MTLLAAREGTVSVRKVVSELLLMAFGVEMDIRH